MGKKGAVTNLKSGLFKDELEQNNYHCASKDLNENLHILRSALLGWIWAEELACGSHCFALKKG